MDRIYPPEIKRYDTADEFKKVFQKFFNSICIQQNDPNFGTLFGNVQKLVSLNIPSKLYKYRGANEFAVSDLKNDEIVCSKPIDFNDPFDSLLYFDIHSIEQVVEQNSRNHTDILHQWELFKKRVSESNIPLESLDDNTRKKVLLSEDEIKNFFHSAEYEQNLQELKNQCRYELGSMVTSLQQHSYIGCFTEINDCPLMWGHYADSHRGFCLEYDLSSNPIWHENFNPSVDCHKYLYPVLYSKERYCAKEFALQQVNRIMGGDHPLYDTLFWFKAYTNKAVNWEYEKEWRVIIIPQNIEDTTKERYFLPLRPTAIYYGLRFEEQPEYVRSTIRELANSKGLRQYKMELKEDDRSYLITPTQIG
ncbi:DUF2971 domain-containing protein [Bacteroides reticulotermitis]|uniref:DUF2971 domain-containing protein n=1 Tax=Bacteroides reticulotermitis TaxID=1133319 RepID=UPI003A84C1EE